MLDKVNVLKVGSGDQGIVGFGFSSVGGIPRPSCFQTKGDLGIARKKGTMKMLAITAGAVFCATVGFADVQSANIVGYHNIALKAGQQAIGGDFLCIGTNGQWLSQITISDVSVSIGAIQIQKLGSTGNMEALYTYCKSAPYPRNVEGWYQNMTRITSANDVFFPAGSGLWVTGLANAKMGFSGEVIQKTDWPVNLKAGQQMVANPFPAEIKLSTIQISGVTQSIGAIQIQKLGSTGNMEALYTYCKGAPYPRNVEGWYQNMTRITTANDVPFAAGQGLWVTGLDGAVMTFKKPY